MSLHAEVKIDTILHATEDIDKILRCFLENFNLEQEKFNVQNLTGHFNNPITCLLYTSPSPRDRTRSRMPSSA